jgi:hypothetical protein
VISYYHSTARARALDRIGQPKAGSWCHGVEPTKKELDNLAQDFNLDRDILEDATVLHIFLPVIVIRRARKLQLSRFLLFIPRAALSQLCVSLHQC